jgi:membrane protein
VFTFLYMFMPNTTVRFKSALVGGVAGGFIWATVGAIFTAFILYASRRLQIYAGFAVAITTLIWLYLNWLILLIGAQLAFYHQRPAFMKTGHREPRLSNSMRERIALNVMLEVGKAFREPGEMVTAGQISDRIKVPSIAVAPIIVALEEVGLLQSTEKEELLPGKEMSRMSLNDILDVVRIRGETGSHRAPRWDKTISALGNELDESMATVVGNRSLSDLLDEYEKKQRKSGG